MSYSAESRQEAPRTYTVGDCSPRRGKRQPRAMRGGRRYARGGMRRLFPCAANP
ncbi:MAG: hypothetical protein OXU61_08310 [Gammaproteobacteria bacterium]|nr:hypothetical protein [Gammaproteobacteria bacterium]